MTTYSTDVAKMESLVDAATRAGQGVETRIATIEQRIVALQTGWHGETAQQHRANADQWKRSMTEMRTTLDSLKSAIDAARTSYIANVDHNRKMWP